MGLVICEETYLSREDDAKAVTLTELNVGCGRLPDFSGADPLGGPGNCSIM